MPAKAASRSAPAGEPFRVLVIDDDPGVRDYMEALVSRQGYTVFAAADAEQALADLDDTRSIHNALRDVDVVIHCAGPFSRTYEAMAKACMETQTHYTDITGEAEVFEGLWRMDTAAKNAGVMLEAVMEVRPKVEAMKAKLKSKK